MKSNHIWVHQFAVFTAMTTVFLLLAGALVTSTGSGLAVPDWPLSFGKVFPPMVGGVFYEHGHRMIAGMVALLSVALMISVLLTESRLWVKTLSVCAVGTVIIQALLGGLTVLLMLPPSVSVAHACIAQIFFCINVILATVTAPSWQASSVSLSEEHEWISLRVLTLVACVGFFCQLLLGAIMRHIGAGLAIPDFPTVFGGFLPPQFSFPVLIHFAHRMGAYTMAVFSCYLAVRIFRTQNAPQNLIRLAIALIGLIVVQITLGALIIWFARPVAITSLHLVVGALCLATTVTLTCRVFRITRPTFVLSNLFQNPIRKSQWETP